MTKNVKVLGASEKNKKALQLALAIPGTTSIYGTAKPDIKYKQQQKKTKFTSLSHPFKLYISFDENNKQVLCMQQGRILLQSTQSRPVAYRYQTIPSDDDGSTPISSCIPVNWNQTDDGTYLVIGIFRVIERNGQLGYNGRCLVVGSQISVEDIPCCEGYLSFYIGTVEKTTIESNNQEQEQEQENKYTLKVINNRIQSDLIVNDFMQIKPFGVYAIIDHGNQNQIKTEYTDWTISGLVCNDGAVYDDINKQVISVSGIATFNPVINGNNYLYLNTDVLSGDIQLDWSNIEKQEYVFDEYDQLIQTNYLIAKVNISLNTVGILQYIDNDIILNQGDTYKIKIDNGDVSENDEKPNFAVNKLYGEFGTLQNQEQDEEYSGYIGVYEQSNAYDEDEKGLGLKWKWCYNQIQGYSDSDYKQLNVQDDTLQWQDAYLVRASSSDDNPDYLANKIQAGSHIQFEMLNNVIGINATPPNIYGVSPISVTQDQFSGWDFTIQFDGSEFIKNVVGGTCISVSKSNGTATISVDKSCIFSNFSITGNSPITVNGSGQSWSISFNDSGFIKSITSQDNSVSINRSGTTVDLSVPSGNLGKVKIDSLDSLDYLGTKFENSNDYINFQIGNKIEAELGPDAVQSDGSIDVDCTNGFALIDVDWTKVVIDQSLAPLISRSVSGESCILSLNVPQGGPYVLMANNGSVSWVQVGQCPEDQPEEQAQEE